jgi:hypothetical protein
MTRNGSASPFPNEFMSPPTWSSQTGSGRRGFRLRRYADGTPTASHRDYEELGGERFAPGVRRPVRLAGSEDVDPVVQNEPDRAQRLVVDPGLDLPAYAVGQGLEPYDTRVRRSLSLPGE